MNIKLTFHRTPAEMGRALKANMRGYRDLFWVVYHGRHRMALRPFGWGFQPTPCTCPECGQSIREPADLRYDLASQKTARMKGVSK